MILLLGNRKIIASTLLLMQPSISIDHMSFITGMYQCYSLYNSLYDIHNIASPGLTYKCEAIICWNCIKKSKPDKHALEHVICWYQYMSICKLHINNTVIVLKTISALPTYIWELY